MKTVVIQNIPRASLNLCSDLASCGVSTVHEAMGRSGLMQPYMRPIFRGACISGPAVTVLAAPGDNWMLHVAIEQCQPGDVLVVGLMADNRDGMIGDLISTALKARGVAGVVIDAGCRDIQTLTEMKFPIWSKAISARGTVKATLGNVNLPVVCAGVHVNPGDAIVADDDGVVVVPRLNALTISQLAIERTKKEAVTRKRYLNGELSLDISNMREALKKAGLKYLKSNEEL